MLLHACTLIDSLCAAHQHYWQCMYIMCVRVHACYKYHILYVCALCVCVSVRCVFSAHRVYSLNSSTSDVMAPSWQPPHPSEPDIEGTDKNVQKNNESY